ncbi:hypothetical protein QR680_006106 [Steinernema hermaphroditum]|uniref:Uncharacterized protein n=1 Tax=Steinernema hermaphroditum TaxID=289476 RepID=A0AA39HUE4_9BILA|nr:hypothetical protein QR680_006106 [Steinernema hermaphroditum]
MDGFNPEDPFGLNLGRGSLNSGERRRPFLNNGTNDFDFGGPFRGMAGGTPFGMERSADPFRLGGPSNRISHLHDDMPSIGRISSSGRRNDVLGNRFVHPSSGRSVRDGLVDIGVLHGESEWTSHPSSIHTGEAKANVSKPKDLGEEIAVGMTPTHEKFDRINKEHRTPEDLRQEFMDQQAETQRQLEELVRQRNEAERIRQTGNQEHRN